MNMWQFMSDSPWLTFFLALIIFSCISSVLVACAKAWAVRKDPNTNVKFEDDGSP